MTDTNRVRLPTFMIAGSQKSGTTSLHRYLTAHSSIYFPSSPQELHFFDIERFFNQGLDYYKQHFLEVRPEHLAVGQTSPLYIYEPKVPARIAEAFPQVQFIFILRNPVDRAYSHYWHSVKQGFETLSFEEALGQEEDRLKQSFQSRRQFSYVDRGYYARQLERFLRHFPLEQMLLLLTEEMRQDPAGVINKCCDFLGIESQGEQIIASLPKARWNSTRHPRSQFFQRFTAPWRPKKNKLSRKLIWWVDQLNLKSISYPAMQPETRQHLETIFAPENERLTTEFNLDLLAWSPVQTEVPSEISF